MSTKPLVVDLDGTLIQSDLLIETMLSTLAQRPQSILMLPCHLFRGKAALKTYLAANGIDPALLPYDQNVIAEIQAAANAGRPTYLASASAEPLVAAVAGHLGLSGHFGSDATNNLKAQAKAELLVRQFGDKGFDYIGNDRADLPIWKVADQAVVVRASSSVLSELTAQKPNTKVLPSQAAGWRTWVRQLRIHQYVKNALLFVPVLTAQAFNASAISATALGFVAFCLCASSVYIVNDLLDLNSDRSHPSKRDRPLASGAIPLATAIIVAPLLLIAGLAVAFWVSPAFLVATSSYVVLTTAYSFYLKRKFLLDAIVLSLLYTMRVFAGAIAIQVVVSQWLLGFSMFIFTALALIKRYTELAVRLDYQLEDSSARNYRASDMDVVLAMAAASGLNAVTVMALYVASEDVHRMYRMPEVLWLICPALLYWIGRALMMARRRWMHDDPIVFAIKDRVSWMCGAFVVCILALGK